jgi:hypothetical protein
MPLQSPLSGGSTKPVPGGRSQKGMKENPKPRGATTTPRVGKGRGLIGSGTADVRDRTPSEQAKNYAGNHGGGYAGLKRGAQQPPQAPPRG